MSEATPIEYHQHDSLVELNKDNYNRRAKPDRGKHIRLQLTQRITGKQGALRAGKGVDQVVIPNGQS